MELNNLKTESTKLQLTRAEKTAMKARVFGVPAPAHLAPAQSPYFIFSMQFMQARVLAPLAVLLVVFASAGTAAAAQGALPGDILYPVKLSVNETVEVALATTPVARAQVEAKQAVRRVEEAEVLASKDALTATTSAQLAANFETHAQAAQVLADNVSAQDPDTGASLKADLGSSLAAHSAILATLGQEGASQGAPSAGAESLATRVLARADQGRQTAAKVVALAAITPQAKMQVTFAAKVASDTSVADASTTRGAADADSQDAAIKLKAKAQAAVVDVRGTFEDTKGYMDATTTAQVTAELAEIDQLMVDGAKALDLNDYVQATAKFTQALGSSIKLSTLLMAQAKIQKNIITPVLENHLILNGDLGSHGMRLPADN